jgi:twinkle protein
MKCVKGEDDYNGQKDFVDQVTAIARDTGMHVHLVHHMKKLEREADIPDKSDVKGTGAIADQVDNMLLVWRNKKKEVEQQAGKMVAQDEPDARLICCKQRNGEWEGRFALWFDPDSQQFVQSSGSPAMDLGTWPHRSIA